MSPEMQQIFYKIFKNLYTPLTLTERQNRLLHAQFQIIVNKIKRKQIKLNIQDNTDYDKLELLVVISLTGMKIIQ